MQKQGVTSLYYVLKQIIHILAHTVHIKSPPLFLALIPCTICNFKWKTNDSKGFYVDFSRLCPVEMTSHSLLPFTHQLRKWLCKLINHLISVHQWESHLLRPTLIAHKGLCSHRGKHTYTRTKRVAPRNDRRQKLHVWLAKAHMIIVDISLQIICH